MLAVQHPGKALEQKELHHHLHLGKTCWPSYMHPRRGTPEDTLGSCGRVAVGETTDRQMKPRSIVGDDESLRKAHLTCGEGHRQGRVPAEESPPDP